MKTLNEHKELLNEGALKTKLDSYTLDELKNGPGISTSDIKKLKDKLTNKVDKIREKYNREQETYNRYEKMKQFESEIVYINTYIKNVIVPALKYRGEY